jgi:hypothetical protein
MSKLPINEREPSIFSEPSIFISHSSNDVVVARAVRNLLEDRNHKFVELIGLAFLTLATEKDVFDLLEKEVQARDWLLLIDSENARASKYVQFEIETAQRLKKPFYSIDCNRFLGHSNRYEIEKILKPCVATFSRGLRLFLSYARRDRQVVQIEDALRSEKYEIWDATTEISPGVDFIAQIRKGIEYVAEQGIFVLFLTKESVQSQWVHAEISSALQLNALFLPILMEKVDLLELPISIRQIQYLDVTQYRSLDDVNKAIVTELNRIWRERFKSSCGGIVLNVE